jgi:hypothetical protein
MSLRELARKLNEKDPSKIGPLPPLYNDDTDGDAELNDLVNGIENNYDSDSSDNGMLGSGFLGQKAEDNVDSNFSTNESQKFDDGSEGKLKRNSDQLDLADNQSSDKFVRNGDNSTNKKIKVTTTILANASSSSAPGGSEAIVTTSSTSSMAGFIGNKNQ